MTDQYRAGRPHTSRRRHRHGWLAALAAAATLCLAQLVYAQGDRTAAANAVEFNIPAQPVPAALSEFAKQARVQLLFITDGFEGVEANAVIGTYAAQHALDLLLAGTGLVASISDDAGVKIQRVPVTGSSSFLDSRVSGTESPRAMERSTHARQTPTQVRTDRGSVDAQGAAKQLEEIVVTGTSIHGVIPESTPLEIYDAVDIQNTGALTVEGFIRTLPQNNNTLSELAAGSSAREASSDSTNSVDLRGLGVGSTLVLLNGRRIAPSSQGRSVDLSFIPIGVVERVEVLTDGASAIYGADAIGGVVNFVLKDQQEGAETALTIGGAEGGNEQLRINQSFGLNWHDGNALIALSYFRRNPLDAADRDFARAAAPFTLVPEDVRRNILATISQSVADSFDLSADLLYSTRRPRLVQTQSQFGSRDFTERRNELEQTVLNLSVERSLFGETTGALLATYAESSRDTAGFLDGPTIGVGPFLSGEGTETLDLAVKVDGQLVQFRSGPLMFAVGGGRTSDDYDTFSDFSGVSGAAPSTSALSRRTTYAFAEIQAPLVSPDQDIYGIRRLELNVAGRYTDYSDFGVNTSPKAGILWSPVESLRIRGTFGESFKAPFLFQLDPTKANYGLFPIALLGTPDIWSDDNSTVMLFALGPGNPSIGPEEARTYTFGFDLNVSDFSLSASYFDIEYTDRIAEPDSSSGSASLVNPEQFPELFNTDPTAEEILAIVSTSRNSFNLTSVDVNDPSTVVAVTTVLADNRIRNLSISELDGLDLRVDYSADVGHGQMTAGLRASRTFGFDERIFESAPPISKAGTVLYPADLKGSVYVGFSGDHWGARLNVNHIDDYRNPFDPENAGIESWSTVDLLLNFEFGERQGALTGVQTRFVVRNVLDEDPPFVPVGDTSDLSLLVPTGFDPANANPIGRFVGLEISKKW